MAPKGRLIEDVKHNYTIEHVGNVSRIEDVVGMLEREKPDVLFAVSMWTSEESTEIQRLAKNTIAGIKTMAIPQGLQAAKGPDGVVAHLIDMVPELLEG